jgi:hypothetical protein
VKDVVVVDGDSLDQVAALRADTASLVEVVERDRLRDLLREVGGQVLRVHEPLRFSAKEATAGSCKSESRKYR